MELPDNMITDVVHLPSVLKFRGVLQESRPGSSVESCLSDCSGLSPCDSRGDQGKENLSGFSSVSSYQVPFPIWPESLSLYTRTGYFSSDALLDLSQT